MTTRQFRHTILRLTIILTIFVLDCSATGARDTTIKFLWREDRYNEQYKMTFSSIFINEPYANRLSDAERAALGYVATFIGNECWWDGEANEDRSNLKCNILTSLNLGYQCSERHLGFLRKWFSADKIALKELENCPTTPYTSTIQDTFDEINITLSGTHIIVWYKWTAINSREESSSTWTETAEFIFGNGGLKLIKKTGQQKK